jgi:hypothetical protein
MKTVRISDELHKKLSTFVTFYGETMNDIIGKCADAYEEKLQHKSSQSKH